MSRQQSSLLTVITKRLLATFLCRRQSVLRWLQPLWCHLSECVGGRWWQQRRIAAPSWPARHARLSRRGLQLPRRGQKAETIAGSLVSLSVPKASPKAPKQETKASQGLPEMCAVSMCPCASIIPMRFDIKSSENLVFCSNLAGHTQHKLEAFSQEQFHQKST